MAPRPPPDEIRIGISSCLLGKNVRFDGGHKKDAFLTGATHAFWRGYREVPVAFDPASDPTTDPREKLHTIGLEKRRHNFTEVEQPWSESTAIRQARRCLRCAAARSGASSAHRRIVIAKRAPYSRASSASMSAKAGDGCRKESASDGE